MTGSNEKPDQEVDSGAAAAAQESNSIPKNHAGREEPVIRDKRRIDPDTFEVRKETAAAAPGDGGPATAPGDENTIEAEAVNEHEFTVDDILNAARAEVDDPSNEHLADLKRITAEYANYRKRTEENRELERQRSLAAVVVSLLPVLDDLDRAKKHGDLGDDSPFATIAAKLRSTVERFGLSRFGENGEAFDPSKHEAIFQQSDPGCETATVADVVEPGYLLGDILIRAAKVVVRAPQD